MWNPIATPYRPSRFLSYSVGLGTLFVVLAILGFGVPTLSEPLSEECEVSPVELLR